MGEELGRMRAETIASIAELDAQIARVTAARANANTDVRPMRGVRPRCRV